MTALSCPFCPWCKGSLIMLEIRLDLGEWGICSGCDSLSKQDGDSFRAPTPAEIESIPDRFLAEIVRIRVDLARRRSARAS